MKTRENTTTFESMNKEAAEFYNRHGWVVINQRLDKLTVDEARSSWVELRERCAQEMGVSMDAYRKEISQWRDLWTHGGAFLPPPPHPDPPRAPPHAGPPSPAPRWRSIVARSHHRKTCWKNQQENSLASRFDVLAG